MAELWELILHHSYTGTPGVIFDQSPSRRSHGTAVNLDDSDFLPDGVRPGSGAINLASGGRVDVVASDRWNPLRGLRVEVVCIRDADIGGNNLISSDTFSLGASPDGNLRISYMTAPDGNWSAAGTGGSEPDEVIKTGIWSTVVWEYDGLSNFHVAIDGVVSGRWSGPFWPLVPPRRIRIGSSADGSSGWKGRIDDVKVWRLNPHRVNDEFVSRPIDESVQNCWAEWFRKLREISRNDTECATTFATLLTQALDSTMRQLVTSGAAARPEFVEASRRYRQLWSEGRLDEMLPVLADLIGWLPQLGVDFNNDPAVQALRNDDCVRRILAALPIDCDSQFTDMITGVVIL